MLHIHALYIPFADALIIVIITYICTTHKTRGTRKHVRGRLCYNIRNCFQLKLIIKTTPVFCNLLTGKMIARYCSRELWSHYTSTHHWVLTLLSLILQASSVSKIFEFEWTITRLVNDRDWLRYESVRFIGLRFISFLNPFVSGWSLSMLFLVSLFLITFTKFLTPFMIFCVYYTVWAVHLTPVLLIQINTLHPLQWICGSQSFYIRYHLPI